MNDPPSEKFDHYEVIWGTHDPRKSGGHAQTHTTSIVAIGATC